MYPVNLTKHLINSTKSVNLTISNIRMDTTTWKVDAANEEDAPILYQLMQVCTFTIYTQFFL